MKKNLICCLLGAALAVVIFLAWLRHNAPDVKSISGLSQLSGDWSGENYGREARVSISATGRITVAVWPEPDGPSAKEYEAGFRSEYGQKGLPCVEFFSQMNGKETHNVLFVETDFFGRLRLFTFYGPDLLPVYLYKRNP